MATVDPFNIRLRRAEEARREAADAMRRDVANVTAKASFEQRTAVKQNRRIAQTKLDEAKAALEADLNRRRRKLAELLEAEKSAYEREIAASFEPPEVTKQRMFDHARQLKERRERERQALVEKLELQRWRNSSDVLRSRNSRLVELQTADERARQVQQKQRALQAEREWEAKMDAEYENTMRQGADRERHEQEKRRILQDQSRRILQSQMQTKEALNHRLKENERQRDETYLANVRQQQQQEQEAELQRRQNARSHLIGAMQFNEQQRLEKSRMAAKEREEDEKRLQSVLAKEKHESDQERANTIARRREALRHKQELEEQMQIQAEEEGALDSLYQQEQDRMWAQRQAEWEREEAHRRALNEEVYNVRANQVIERQRQAEIDKYLDEKQLAADRARAAEGEKREQELQQARRRGIQRQAQHVRDQVAERERLREREKQAEYLAAKLQQREEERYQARVQQLLAEEPPAMQYHRKRLE